MTRERDRPAEIEVTEEMIEAGLEELSRYRYDRTNDEKIMVKIFRRMMEARRPPDDQQCRG